MPATVDGPACRPAAGSNTLSKRAANGTFISVMALKIPFGPQPDNTTAQRAAVPAHFQCLGKTIEKHPNKTMPPKPTAAAPAAFGSGPRIITAKTINSLEIQINMKYHNKHVLGSSVKPWLLGRLSAGTLSAPFFPKKMAPVIRDHLIRNLYHVCQFNQKILRSLSRFKLNANR